MLVVSRFRVETATEERFAGDLESALTLLAGQPGCEDGRLGRNLDDPGLWVLVTRWADVGSYRRALSSYDVKLALGVVSGRMVDEPSAYETETGDWNRNVPR